MIYVDRIQKTKYNKFSAFNYYSFCHLTADSLDELLEFGKLIGLKEIWLHESNKGVKHFDITLNKRKQALKLGAKEKGIFEGGEGND
jgi:hypothetical protein